MLSKVIKGSEPPVSLPVLQANPLGLHSVAVIKAGYQRFWTPSDLLTCSTCRPAMTVPLQQSRQEVIEASASLAVVCFERIQLNGCKMWYNSRTDAGQMLRIWSGTQRVHPVSSGCEAFCRGFEGDITAHPPCLPNCYLPGRDKNWAPTPITSASMCTLKLLNFFALFLLCLPCFLCYVALRVC